MFHHSVLEEPESFRVTFLLEHLSLRYISKPNLSFLATMDGPDYTERASSEIPIMPYGPHEVNDGEMPVDTPTNAFNHSPHADQEISPGEESVLRSDVRPAHAHGSFYLTN